MSYKLGADAFVRRFQKRFPETEYQWETQIKGETRTYIIRYKNESIDICSIRINTVFGIKLTVCSDYLNDSKFNPKRPIDHYDWPQYFVLYRRPLRLIHGNQHDMRKWLKDKPKFSKLGANLSKIIKANFLATKE